MFERLFRGYLKSLPWRCGVGLLLCANYACTPNREMVSHDPFVAEPNTTELAASSNPPPQSNAADQIAALAAQSQQLSQESEGAQIRIGQEWPAMPEKQIGIAPPETQTHTVAATTASPLPPGGYEQPLEELAIWADAPQANTSPRILAHKAQPETTPVSPKAAEPIQQVAYAEPTAASQSPAASPATPPEWSDEAAITQVAATAAPMPAAACPPAMPACPPGHPGMAPTLACPPFPTALPYCGACQTQHHPDEYLCDGGDRRLPVHYSPGTRHGLDTQDTIAEYTDENGDRQLRITNEVCVYAPRFAAVKTVAGSSENLGVDRALGAYESVHGAGFQSELMPRTEQRNQQLEAARVRSRPSGLETEALTLGMQHVTQLTEHTKLENTNTDYGFVGQIALEKAEVPITVAGRTAAAVWTRLQSPVIIANDVAGAEMHSLFRPEELVGSEDRSRPGNLFIDKAADKAAAKPGDVITFTIRYKNTGDRGLFNVQVLDNLTPRLEFIEGSGTSDRDGRLVVEDNQEGSLILKFEIAGELPGGEGGTVTFQTRVR